MDHFSSAIAIIDLGCGPNKVPGAFGADIFPYEGVDVVMDLDAALWPLRDDTYSTIFIRHVIEHVSDVRSFLNKVHCIGVDGAVVEIITPHFSSLDSWKDPTHRWHFSSSWYLSFTESYMSKQIARFEHQSTEVTFRKNIRCWIPRLIVRLKGYEWWEKHYAFTYTARNIITRLKVVK